MKKNQNGFGLIPVVVALLIVGLIAGISWRVLNQTNSQSNSVNGKESETSKSSVAETNKISIVKGTEIQSSSYYEVKLSVTGEAQGNPYYGKVTSINSKYLRISPVYYKDKSGNLVLLGKELHAPEPAMYVALSAVESVIKLDTGDPRLIAIQNSAKATPPPNVKDAAPSKSINSYIKSGQYQAVFMSDGKVFFGKAKSVDSTPIFKNADQVFYLTASGNQVSLSKATDAQISAYTGDAIIFWENMNNAGQISEAISTYIKQNP